MVQGIIFDIQRFSVHDGPGIRTTVFMKGCPLRCAWCHNPEGLSRNIQLQYKEQECIHCNRCGNRLELADAYLCPTGALSICGREISTAELLDELLKDEIYYGENGGITFSGGECLLQADFVSQMLKHIKELNISTVVDTSGYTHWDSFERTLPYCDLYLYDIKSMNKEKHIDFTGVDNEVILNNLMKLTKAGGKVWIRIPVIPEFNDTREDMEQIAEYLVTLDNIIKVRLMSYHTLGKSKYSTLGIPCQYNTNKRITKEQIKEFCKIFQEKGIVMEEE